jgi:hypothetical protein
VEQTLASYADVVAVADVEARAGQHPTDVPGARRAGSRETERIYGDRKDGSMKTTPHKRVHS